MTNRLFVSLLATIVAVGALFGYKWEAKRHLRTAVQFDRRGDFETGPVPQKSRTRDWIALKTKRLWNSQTGIVGPINVEVGPLGTTVVFDYGDMSVKELSSKGHVLGYYGAEHLFKSLTDVAFDPRGGILIADNASNQIVIFDRERRLRRSVSTNVGPFRLAATRDGMFVMLPYPHQTAFGQLNLTGKTKRLFGRLASNQREGILALSGWIEATNDGGFIYVSEYSGAIARYDNEGRPVYLRAGIDRAGLPDIVTDSKGLMFVDRETSSMAYNISLDQNKIYVLAPTMDGLKKLGALDVYDIDTGDYLHSLRIPDRCSQAIVQFPYVYTVRSNTVSKWQIDANEPV